MADRLGIEVCELVWDDFPDKVDLTELEAVEVKLSIAEVVADRVADKVLKALAEPVLLENGLRLPVELAELLFDTDTEAVAIGEKDEDEEVVDVLVDVLVAETDLVLLDVDV